jgi:hypothetical protein
LDSDIPYMPAVKNLHPILNAMQKAAVPDAFGLDFLKDMGFTSSNDRTIIKVLKYLGFLDNTGKPQAPYREFINHTKSKKVLASRLRFAFDDLFAADRNAANKSASDLKGWFKTKTGVGDGAAEKMATTFKSLASYADFSGEVEKRDEEKQDEGKKDPEESKDESNDEKKKRHKGPITLESGFGLTYRIEVHLPDTSNIETYRAIFHALREELLT